MKLQRVCIVKHWNTSISRKNREITTGNLSNVGIFECKQTFANIFFSFLRFFSWIRKQNLMGHQVIDFDLVIRGSLKSWNGNPEIIEFSSQISRLRHAITFSHSAPGWKFYVKDIPRAMLDWLELGEDYGNNRVDIR